jgi:hypothetical protein
VWPTCSSISAAADPAEVERLVRELGADEFATREAAQLALIELGPDAVPALERLNAA